MKMRTLVAAAAVGFTMLLAEGVAAAEIKVLSVVPLKTSLDELGPQFERATGHKLMIKYEGSGALKRQFDAGETFDVALIFPALIDDLLKQGKVAAGTRADIARVAIGVAVKKGAPQARYQHGRRVKTHAAQRQIDSSFCGRCERDLC